MLGTNIQRIFGLVASIFIYMDNPLGRGDAASKTYAEKNKARRLYGGMRRARVFVWNLVRARTGNFVRAEHAGNAGMDCRGSAL